MADDYELLLRLDEGNVVKAASEAQRNLVDHHFISIGEPLVTFPNKVVLYFALDS